jgi:hypothetical protein
MNKTPGRRSFSVWHDNQEQWDPDHIDEPALRCHAGSEVEAAERLADDGDSNHVSVIVRDDNADTYRQIELTRNWSVKHSFSTSLAELSAS